ncbi:hypothetical protein [uncultured Cohaesibacter sp.]|uniref:hypothetical protein n=1 Tax=uncultured Cohaesibacter sp. TaxID=1002546 RepID=UPI00293168CC|nr:hypothetical protein [uncultured Cohaesibacter sp.]
MLWLRACGLELDNDAMVDEAIEEHIRKEQDRWFPRELITTSGFNYVCNFGSWSPLAYRTRRGAEVKS